MLKRDSLTAQMQQLSYTLAKVKRLIVEDENAEAYLTVSSVLADYFGTNITDLLETPANIFIQNLKRETFKPEELGLLADFLDVAAQLEESDASRHGLWQKVILIYDLLEEEHKVISFEHIARRDSISQEINKRPL